MAPEFAIATAIAQLSYSSWHHIPTNYRQILADVILSSLPKEFVIQITSIICSLLAQQKPVKFHYYNESCHRFVLSLSDESIKEHNLIMLEGQVAAAGVQAAGGENCKSGSNHCRSGQGSAFSQAQANANVQAQAQAQAQAAQAQAAAHNQQIQAQLTAAAAAQSNSQPNQSNQNHCSSSLNNSLNSNSSTSLNMTLGQGHSTSIGSKIGPRESSYRTLKKLYNYKRSHISPVSSSQIAQQLQGLSNGNQGQNHPNGLQNQGISQGQSQEATNNTNHSNFNAQLTANSIMNLINASANNSNKLPTLPELSLNAPLNIDTNDTDSSSIRETDANRNEKEDKDEKDEKDTSTNKTEEDQGQDNSKSESKENQQAKSNGDSPENTPLNVFSDKEEAVGLVGVYIFDTFQERYCLFF